MTFAVRIIIVSILFAVLLFAISIGFNNKNSHAKDEDFQSFLIFSRAYIFGVIGYLVIYLLDDKYITIKYIFLIIIWYCYCFILSSMIMQSIRIFKSEEKWIRNCSYIICYYAIFSSLIELFFYRFSFDSNSSGIEFYPGIIPDFIYYATPIIIYYVCMGNLLYKYYITHTKKRERHLFKLALYTVIPSLAGLVTESFFHVYLKVCYPIFYILLIISYKLMYDLHIKNRSFNISRNDFEQLLSADKTDVIFVCNDEFDILFENKAASINKQLFKDEYIGRKITEVFLIEKDIQRAMYSKETRKGLMVQAIYPVTDHKVVMSIEYIYDCVDEILCSIITIPNYEVAIDKDFFKDIKEDPASLKTTVKYDEKIVYNEDTPITQKDKSSIDINSNILLVDDKIDNFIIYEKYFEPYELRINKAVGGRSALNKLLEPCYDVIFIAYDMSKLNGVETAKRIRSMGGDYYSDVPIIFIINCPVDEIYRELLEVSFNDFIEMPLSSRKLNTILTRWLWRRYALTDVEDYDSVGMRIARFMDNIDSLCNDCMELYSDEKWDLIGYILKGIKRLCTKLEEKNLLSLCDLMLDNYLNKNYDKLPVLLSKFQKELDRIRISGNVTIKY
ncbi:MAG: response regulator [Lachnospiraceae bacterium]|nr:response regulator [Lachnospiraceae bacterium]